MLGILRNCCGKTSDHRGRPWTFAKWNEAKSAKDFDAADVYRKALSEKGLL
jgi:hypothetical protein